MPKYLLTAKYTSQGLIRLLKEGWAKRKEDLSNALKEMNGEGECLYFTFGDHDVYSIVNLPDNMSAVSVALQINASGAAEVKTSVLLDPAEIDEVARLDIKCRPPGG